MQIGRVGEIWRYPVKSMGGERLAATPVETRGLPGDRIWAVRDEVRGGIRGAKKISSLMGCKARLGTEHAGDVPEITLPDGDRFAADAADAAPKLSAALGQPVTLWPLLPADRLDHYRRGAPSHPDVLTELRSVFALDPGESLPNLTSFPAELLQYESPPGTYFDAFPILLLPDASLRRLQRLCPASRVDVRRFRPNFLIETPEEPDAFLESAWAGQRIRLGRALLEATVACPRCVMITHGFDDLPQDSALMRAVVREADHQIGVYARVLEPGRVAVGDIVEILD
jgi:uncharacterized protein YcbX